MDEINAGNTDMIDLLPKYSKKDTDDLAGKNKDYWDDWFKKHSEDIKALKNCSGRNKIGTLKKQQRFYPLPLFFYYKLDGFIWLLSPFLLIPF